MDKKQATWDHLVVGGYIPRHEVDFVGELQASHDLANNDDFINSFKAAMRGVARVYDLNPAILEAV